MRVGSANFANLVEKFVAMETSLELKEALKHIYQFVILVKIGPVDSDITG